MTEPVPSANAPELKRPGWHYHAAFIVLNFILAWLVFGGAFTGRDLLAPLDIEPVLNPNYKWADPNAGNVPANHTVSDIFTHELPRQFAIYDALRHGEFPWWEPYTQDGRPLMADALISSADPIRLGFYCLLPFETAYNWSKIIPTMLCGLGMYLLLGRLGFRGSIAVFCALAYEFGTGHFLMETPLSVVSSFAYYALLWWAWDSLLERFRGWLFALSVWLTASIFLAGNQQAHAYLALFALSFLVGYGLNNRSAWKRLFAIVAGSWVGGCLIALPILVAQLEIFFLSSRAPSTAGYRLEWLTGLCNVTALFPWLMGTFKTVDAAKLFNPGQGGISFNLYLGSAVVALAAGGITLHFCEKKIVPFVRTAILLTAIYELICLTPLINFLYTRASDLACLGLTVLCAHALRRFFEGTLGDRARRVVRGACFGVLLLFIAANLGALVIFPRIQARFESYVLRRADASGSFPSASEMRRDQVANLPLELSFHNIETVAAAAAALGLFLLLRPGAAPTPRRRTLCYGLLALNLVPLLMFDNRFAVRFPVQLWDRLIHADSDQSRAASKLGLQYRLDETYGFFTEVFPAALPILYKAHVTTTYSSFGLPEIAGQIHSLGLNLAEADARLDAPQPGHIVEEIVLRPPSSGTSRFQWLQPVERPVKVVKESLNEITIEVAPGPPGRLVRTDRYYPGWRLVEPLGFQTELLGKAFLAVDVPASAASLTFRYTPRWLSITWPISVAAIAAFVLVAAIPLFRGGNKSSSQGS